MSAVAVDGERRNESSLRMPRERSEEFVKDCWLNFVVVVEEEEERACRELCANVAAHGLKAVRLVARVADARVVAERGADLVARVVRRAVVHDDDLERGVVRCEDGAHAVADHLRAVVSRDDD